MILTIILFLALLSILVVAHEFGHFAAARKAGMVVEEFGLGFPPRLFSWKDKKGTTWSVNLIPIGGFVRIQGENGENRTSPGSFASKSYFARFAVLFGGVFMNIVLAMFLFGLGFVFGLPAIVEGGVDPQAIITNREIAIVQVLPGSPAEKAGLVTGDLLLSIDDQEFTDGQAAREALIPESTDDTLKISVRREGEMISLEVLPEYIAEIDREGIGIALVETGTVRYPWYLAPVKGVIMGAGMTVQVTVAFADLLASLVTRENVAAQLSGPVGIAVLTGQVAKLGWAHLVQFAAMLSVNLAVLNIIPFPALDGGRLLFLAIEAMRRKPVSENIERIVHATGFVLLLILVIAVTYKDLVKLF